ncbi:MAG: hypothetical protein ITG02_02405 [Patulibacter sp.]|nr:hypothetical protein [Patulibacter sp.]
MSGAEVYPSLARGPGSHCDLDGATLDNPSVSPRINGEHDFDASCRALAARLAAGFEVTFTYGCVTKFHLTLTPEVALPTGRFPDWVGPARPGYLWVEKRIGDRGQVTDYPHRLRGGSWQYIAEKQRLKEHDAKALSYLLAALGEAVNELGGMPLPAIGEGRSDG